MSGTVQSSIQVRAYVRVLLLSTQTRLQYRFRFYVPLVSGTIWVVVQMSLWIALYRRSGLSPANMGGLRLNDVLTYVTLSYFIGQLYPSHLVGRMSQDVRDGGLNPSTGEVLAMASLPSFDPNQLSAGLSSAQWQKLTGNGQTPLLNKALSPVPPGSSIKPCGIHWVG